MFVNLKKPDYTVCVPYFIKPYLWLLFIYIIILIFKVVLNQNYICKMIEGRMHFNKFTTHCSVSKIFNPAVKISRFTHQPGEIAGNGCVKIRSSAWGGKFLKKFCSKLSRPKSNCNKKINILFHLKLIFFPNFNQSVS